MMRVDAGDNQEGQNNGWELKPCSHVFCKFKKNKSQISIYEGDTSFHKETKPSFITYLNSD